MFPETTLTMDHFGAFQLPFYVWLIIAVVCFIFLLSCLRSLFQCYKSTNYTGTNVTADPTTISAINSQFNTGYQSNRDNRPHFESQHFPGFRVPQLEPIRLTTAPNQAYLQNTNFTIAQTTLIQDLPPSYEDVIRQK
ncbi:Hypothetical predicted protein [Pelobates cultripes]|uniref:Uncharacterized protein n=1 Tax=Pelobates cultripes TaxID=61616 RepID=A0AAD1W803_PELCU|nr:Hypothetical predicted protein [Pelobates cultripes]